jgi:hypothetical protein
MNIPVPNLLFLAKLGNTPFMPDLSLLTNFPNFLIARLCPTDLLIDPVCITKAVVLIHIISLFELGIDIFSYLFAT